MATSTHRTASLRPESRSVAKQTSYTTGSLQPSHAGGFTSKVTIQKQPKTTPGYMPAQSAVKYPDLLSQQYNSLPNRPPDRRKSMDPGARAKPALTMTHFPTNPSRIAQATKSEVQRLAVKPGPGREDRTRVPSRGSENIDKHFVEGLVGTPQKMMDAAKRTSEDAGRTPSSTKDTKSQYKDLIMTGAQAAGKLQEAKYKTDVLHAPEEKPQSSAYTTQTFVPGAKTVSASPAEIVTAAAKQDSIPSLQSYTPASLAGHPARPPSASKRESGDSSLASQSTMDTLHRPPSSKQLNSFSSVGQSSLASYSDSDLTKIVGLRNFGNICFMNAIIQCLYFAPGFESTLNQSRSDMNSASKTEGALYKAVLDVLADLRSGKKSSVSVIGIKTVISTVASQFNSYDQHDAHEFLRFLLDGLHEDLNRSRDKHPSTKLSRTITETRKLPDLSEEWWRDSLMRSSSSITDLFQGQLVNIITCTVCRNSSYTFDVFLDLSVPVPTSDLGRYSLSASTLQQCFDEFTSEKELEGVKCKQCKAVRVCRTRMMVYRFPKLLVIHLKRFAVTTYSEVKINTAVACPMAKLDLSKYAQSSHESARRPLYDLHGIVHHFGDVDFGHYYAYVSHSECFSSEARRWFNLDDTRVSTLVKPSENSRSAYILFYALQSAV